MGNSHPRTDASRNTRLTAIQREGQFNTSQFSISQLFGNLSGRSNASISSTQTTYSSSRPWSRVSRRRWNDTTLRNPLEASKTAWPVAHKESIFLPEFPIANDLQNKIELQDTIAKGAFGEVCRVKKLDDNKVYALKVLSKSKIIAESAVRQVKDEAQIQQVCGHHCYIVGAFARWQTKKQLYILSEYVPCGELCALLERCGRAPAPLARLYLAEIAVALDFLHGAGVVHRDVKAENVLLDGGGHARLADFGLARWLRAGAAARSLCGTLRYVAPEVVRGEGYGHAVDWWSLGVLACRMITGEFPAPAVPAAVTGAVPAAVPGAPCANGDGVTTVATQELMSQERQSAGPPGTLPAAAGDLDRGARALLLRLLDPQPARRLRNLRQLQQTAYYMGYDFDLVRKMKVSPKPMLDSLFPDGFPDSAMNSIDQQEFSSFGE